MDITGDYAGQGFLFHGSPVADLAVLEPRLANDINTDSVFNNDTAVFAADNPGYAVIFALLDTAKLKERCRRFSWAAHSITHSGGRVDIVARFPALVKDLIEQATGYVYILPPETFMDRHLIQHKSRVAVTPHAVCAVTLADFRALGGRITWIDDATPTPSPQAS